MTSTSATSAHGDLPRHGGEQQLRDVLQGYGLRRTAQRLAVLYLLTEEHGRHLTTAEIHERLVGSGTDVDLATVYRTITTLLNLGVLHATAHQEQATSYGLAAESHHHAVCTRCGSVSELASDVLREAIEVAQRTTDFRLVDSVITIHGLCADCQTT